MGSNPILPDTDLDGSLDGEETAAGANPIDWYSQPGAPDAVALVPGDFDTIAEALHAMQWSGDIQLTEAREESILVRHKDCTLLGQERVHSTLLSASPTQSVLIAEDAHLSLLRLTLSNGLSSTSGGGLQLIGSRSTLQDVQLSSNQATSDGGGLYAHFGSLDCQRCLITDNNTVNRNGGGALLEFVSTSFEQSLIAQNGAYANGGGLFVVGGTLLLSHSAVQNNSARFSGGGIYAFSGAILTMTQAILSSNLSEAQTSSSNGGALYLDDGTLSVEHTIVAENGISSVATDVAGGFFVTSVTPNSRVSGALFYRNSHYNLFHDREKTRPPLSILYSDLYNNSGSNVNLSLDASNLQLEPGFLTYSEDHLHPLDWHLSLSSPLVDQGNDAERDLDGSPADIGIYGGLLGATWDLDFDLRNAYFWPGDWSDHPSGVNPAEFDCDDLDPLLQACQEP